MTTFSSSPIVVGDDRPTVRHADVRDAVLKLAIVTVSLFIVIAVVMQQTRAQAFHILWKHELGRPFLILGSAYAGLTAVWSAWRLVLAIRYKPAPPVTAEALPRITVVVPVFNEGALIADTLQHLARCDYPDDRIEVIVVNDGSTDDTWKHIERAVRLWDRFSTGRTIQTHRLSVNQGKRHALYEGFRRATGDILVTVDSDSLIASDALRDLVSPLVRDPRVGAVAGNVRVLNKSDGLIPRMLDVRYVMTFDYKRAAQSEMSDGGVLCVAGALAAYRRSAVEPIMDEWLHQRWLGRPARAGEDHAMTNFIRRQGYNVTFQRTARVRTLAPTTYAGISRMFLRWGRSNVRETVHLATILIRGMFGGRHVMREIRPALLINFLIGATGLIVPYLFLAAAVVLTFALPSIFGLKLLSVCVASGVFPLIFAASRDRHEDSLLAILYSFYAMLLLSWVWPYALVTSHKSVWMTRDTA